MAFLKDEEKQTILESYFDIEWCDDVSDLRCVHCHRVAIHPYVSSCQHIFCKICKKFYSVEEQRLSCPRCQEQLTQLDNQDFEMEVRIHRLKIFCPNKKYGCNYADQLRKIPPHLMVCVHTRNSAAALQVEAPVTNTIAEVVNQLTNLNSTIGEIKEGLREVKDTVDQLEKKSDDIDSKINGLINDGKKNEGTNSIEQLASTNYNDEFQSMRLKLESVIQIIQQSELLHQHNKGLKKDEVKAKLHQQDNIPQNKKPEELNHLKTESYEWTIKDVEKNILDDKGIYESEGIKFTGCRYDIKAKINHHDGLIWIGLQFNDGDEINRFLDNEAFTAVTYIVRDQSDGPMKEDIVCQVYLGYYDGCGVSQWILRSVLPEVALSPPYTKDDCMKVTILFEPASIDCHFVSDNGVLLWRLDNYAQRKKEDKLEDIWSPPFYTGPKGYRVRIQLSVYDSQSISVYVRFLTGEHDATLSPVFFHETTVTLVNQTNPSKNLVKRRERDLAIFNTFDLKTKRSIEESGFIKDDSLLLEVAITHKDLP